MIDDLQPELSFGEGLSGRDWLDWLDWLVDLQTSLASWKQDQHRRLT